MDHPELMPAAPDDFLLEIMTGYYGRKFALARTSAVRFHPIDEVSDAAYLWHHGRARAAVAPDGAAQ